MTCLSTQSNRQKPAVVFVAVLACWAMSLVSTPVSAQDLEPRRWSHLPSGVAFVGVVCERDNFAHRPVAKLRDFRSNEAVDEAIQAALAV